MVYSVLPLGALVFKSYHSSGTNVWLRRDMLTCDRLQYTRTQNRTIQVSSTCKHNNERSLIPKYIDAIPWVTIMLITWWIKHISQTWIKSCFKNWTLPHTGNRRIPHGHQVSSHTHSLWPLTWPRCSWSRTSWQYLSALTTTRRPVIWTGKMCCWWLET